MATNRNSTSVAALEGFPAVLPPAGLGHNALYVQKGFLAVPTGDVSNGVYRMIRVPAAAVMHDLLRMHTALTSLGLHVGVWRTPDDGGTVVSQQFFASVGLGTAVTSPSSLININGLNNPPSQVLPLWQAAGLPAPPPSQYLDICGQINTPSTAAGSLIFFAYYSV